MRTEKYAGLNMQVHDLPGLVFKNRIVEALEQGMSRYPIFRSLRFAARVEMEVLLDAIALDPSWHAERVEGHCVVLDAEGLFVTGYGGRKADYSSFAFFIYAASPQVADSVRERILSMVDATRITSPMFTVNWSFLTGHGDIESASIGELADDVLHDEAYPEIRGGVHAFVESYLDAKEAVLVLQGPPGTGKTRLIRAILGEMARRRPEGDVQVLYTGDMRALASDQIFVRFITGWEDAFVVEDADHLLKPRYEGNEHLHRFLTIADGVVRSQGRKIIFSTNLPNVGDLDEALVRPGRCFARVNVRALTADEARAFALKVAAGDRAKVERAHAAFAGSREHSLASVYRALQ